MADSFSLSVLTEPFVKEKAAQAKRVDRATMWALREVARRVKREAGRNAPKLSGAYKSSIKSTKQLKRVGDGYSVTVGPRGAVVNPKGTSVAAYAGKVEAAHQPMHKGYEATLPEIVALHAKAWQKAMGN